LRLIAIVLFCLLWIFTSWKVLGWPRELTFGGDANSYSESAVNLLTHGFYSYDGITPNIVREPGESLLLTVAYALFGVNNALGAFFLQGLLYLAAVLVFTRAFARISSERAADITLFILCILPAVFRMVVSLNREAVSLSLFLFLAAAVLHLARKPSWKSATLIGFLCGALWLAYVPYALFAPFLVIVFWGLKIPQKYIVAVLLATALTLTPWALRNEHVAGRLCLLGCSRTNQQWYVRGEMSEHLTGFMPLRCLYAEYVSRNWTGLSPYCNFNAVMHRGWPQGLYGDTRDDLVGQGGKQKILAHFSNYLWLAVTEVIEFHMPYTDFWGRTYNLLEAAATLFLYLGMLLSLPRMLRDRRLLLLWVPIVYSIGLFSLTDAIPRYRMPVLFCYAALSALGYTWLLSKRLWNR
jgi:hypothetical protein